MRVEANQDTCEGAGYCEQVAPALFHVTDEGWVEVLQPDVPAELADAAAEAEDLCPTRSIRVIP